MSARAHILAPKSMIVFGGYDLKFLPLEDLFASVPCSIGIFDDGTAFVKMAPFCGKEESGALVQRFGSIPNLMIRTKNGLFKTPEADILMQSYDVQEDIPIHEPDLTHGKKYQHLNASISNPTLPLDRIGRNPLSVYYGNLCRGRCVFCFLEKNTVPPPSPEELMAIIERDFDGHDSLNFECSDILAHRDGIRKFAMRFKESRFANIPKKAPARADSVGDGTVLKEMASAGFKVLSFGIESFDSGVLDKLRKKTTREQNIRALELSLEAGIRPGINLILYTPWDTLETTIDTIEQSLYFVERGAYLNIAPRIHIRHGTDNLGERIVFRSYRYPGMYKSFKVPFAADIRDPKLRRVAHRAFNINKHLLKSYAPFAANTICVKSLLNVKSFYIAYGKTFGFSQKVRRSISRIDRIIEKTIADMKLTGRMGSEHTFFYDDYDGISVPIDDASSSLRMTEYVTSKFPAELLDEMRGHRNSIELHSGPQSATIDYIRQLAINGYSVRELKTNPPRIRKYYVAQKGKDRKYIISNSIGHNRELFVMQALFLCRYPEQKITIRKFPFDMRSTLLHSLSSYAGNIDKAMFAHNAEFVAQEYIKHIDPGAKIIDTIKNDFIDARMVLTQNQRLILFCEIEYTNGEQIKPMVEFFTDDVNMRGLSIKEIVLYAACGAVGKDVCINDILCYSKAYRYGKRVENPAPNRVEAKILSTFIPRVNVHSADFFTVPTVISSSASFIEELKSENAVGIELELAHALDALSKKSNVCFRAMYEVHDKPAAVDQAEKRNSIGNDVPGLRNREKSRETLVGILRYLQFAWNLEDAIRQDAHRVGSVLERIPPLMTSIDASEYELIETLRSREGNVIVAIAGLSATGKTTIASKQVREIINRSLGEKAAVVSGDSFVFPKNMRPVTNQFPKNFFNIELIKNFLHDFKKGKRIGTRIYDPAIRSSIRLSESEVIAIEKDGSKALEISGINGNVYLLGEELSKQYKGKMRNENSDIGVDEDGYIVEILNKNTKFLVFEVTIALLPSDMRKLYDYAYFIWSPVNSRLSRLKEAKNKGERYWHYGEEEIEARFSRMMQEEDPLVMPTLEFSDMVIVNSEIDSIEKSGKYIYDVLFKKGNKFLNINVLQKIVQDILAKSEFKGTRYRGGIVGSSVYLSDADGFVDVSRVGDIDLFIEEIGEKNIDGPASQQMFVLKLKEELGRYFSLTITPGDADMRTILINDVPNTNGSIQINIKTDTRVTEALLMVIKKYARAISERTDIAPAKRIKHYLADMYYLNGRAEIFEQIKREYLDALEMPEDKREERTKTLCQKAALMSNEITDILDRETESELIGRVYKRLYRDFESYHDSIIPQGEIEAFDELVSLASAKLSKEFSYEIKYDISRLTPSQVDIVETYISLLQSKSSKPDNIKPRPFSSANGSKESLIAVYCTGEGFKGEGHVDVSIPEGKLEDYLLRITGMLNIALASSSIPDNLSVDNMRGYRPILSYINNQYKSILGEELAIPDDPEKILAIIRKIVLGLPTSMRLDSNKIEEYNRLTKEALVRA